MLNDSINRNDVGIWVLLPSQPADSKHLHVVVEGLEVLEPVHVGKWMQTDAKV